MNSYLKHGYVYIYLQTDKMTYFRNNNENQNEAHALSVNVFVDIFGLGALSQEIRYFGRYIIF